MDTGAVGGTASSRLLHLPFFLFSKRQHGMVRDSSADRVRLEKKVPAGPSN
jgi:hypothetical protein